VRTPFRQSQGFHAPRIARKLTPINNSAQRRIVKMSSKDNSPLKLIERVEKTASEKKHRSIEIDTREQMVSVTITQWNVKSAGLFVKSNDHKTLISIIHSTEGTNADIFCFQESLWVPRMFSKHIIRQSNDPNYSMLGDGKDAGIYFQNKTVAVEDITAEISFKGKAALKKRFVVGLVTINPKYNEDPRQFILANAHMPYVGYTNRSRVANAKWLIEQLRLLHEQYELPVVLCGDFNCDLHEPEVSLPEDFTLVGNNGHNAVDATGYLGSAVKLTTSNVDWETRHFSDEECALLGGKEKATKIINSYSLGGSHKPLCYVVSRPISDLTVSAIAWVGLDGSPCKSDHSLT
jgi:exonuclease III